MLSTSAMDCAQASAWNSSIAREFAREISTISGLYCGPAVVGWIAAVWNNQKGRPYDFMTRLKDKDLFPDGPRTFRFNIPGFQTNLGELLRRETMNELLLSSESYYHYSNVHDSLLKFEMPVIVRMLAPKFNQGLHYATLYKSERQSLRPGEDSIQLYWQDNGLYTNNHENNPGLTKTEWKKNRIQGFLLGAKRVVLS